MPSFFNILVVTGVSLLVLNTQPVAAAPMDPLALTKSTGTNQQQLRGGRFLSEGGEQGEGRCDGNESFFEIDLYYHGEVDEPLSLFDIYTEKFARTGDSKEAKSPLTLGKTLFNTMHPSTGGTFVRADTCILVSSSLVRATLKYFPRPLPFIISPLSYFTFKLNGRIIANKQQLRGHEDDRSYLGLYEHFILADNEVCPKGESRFSLDLSLPSQLPGQAFWELRDAATQEIVVDHQITLLSGAATYATRQQRPYSPNRASTTHTSLSVDRCLSPGSYIFTIVEKEKDNIFVRDESPTTYDISLDGRRIRRGGPPFSDFTPPSGEETVFNVANTTEDTIRCPKDQAMFEIEARYDGDPNDFNIATAALGLDADAPEIYHLNLGNNDDGTLVRRQGCFEINQLYRFVVYHNNSKSRLLGFPGYFPGYYALSVNGRKLVENATVDYFSTFGEYYFMGDTQYCSAGDSRFSLQIAFHDRPQDVTWYLSEGKYSQDQPSILSYESSLKEDTSLYSGEFMHASLDVDHCLRPQRSVDGPRLVFSMYDSGFFAPRYYYGIALNDTLIHEGYMLRPSEFTTFKNVDPSVSSTPTVSDLPSVSSQPSPAAAPFVAAPTTFTFNTSSPSISDSEEDRPPVTFPKLPEIVIPSESVGIPVSMVPPTTVPTKSPIVPRSRPPTPSRRPRPPRPKGFPVLGPVRIPAARPLVKRPPRT